jgi:hypothetical protein
LFHSRPRWCRFFLACLLWAAAAMHGAEHDAVFTSAEEQEKWLADAMALVQHHAFYMHRALVSNFFSFRADLLTPHRFFFFFFFFFFLNPPPPPPPPLSLCFASLN